MKKLALILAMLMVACFAFVACEEANPEDSSSKPNETSSTAPADTTSEAPTESSTPNEDPGTVTPAADTLVSGQLVDFVAASDKTDLPQGVVFIPGSSGSYDVSATTGKSFADGTSFGEGNAIQLGANGAYNSKAIKFKVASAGTLTVYCITGGSGYEPDVALYTADGTLVSITPSPYASSNVPVTTITIPAAGEYVIYSNKADVDSKKKSINVFGMKFVA